MIRAFGTTTYPLKSKVTTLLHSEESLFDWYELIKEASRWFVVSFLAFISVLLTAFVGLLAEWGSCHSASPSAVQFLPVNFFIVSGIYEFHSDSGFCVWANTFAVVMGVYIFIPIFGAVVLVRLLAPTTKGPLLSNQFILSKRNGLPILQCRAVSRTGRVYTGFEVDLEIAVVYEDEETGEGYAKLGRAEFLFVPSYLSGEARNLTHVIDERSPLYDVLLRDEGGSYRLDHSRLGRISIMAKYDAEFGGRSLVTLRA